MPPSHPLLNSSGGINSAWLTSLTLKGKKRTRNQHQLEEKASLCSYLFISRFPQREFGVLGEVPLRTWRQMFLE